VLRLREAGEGGEAVTGILRSPAPLEAQEQRWLFEWIETQRVSCPELLWTYAVPNGGKRPKGTAGQLKSQGLRSGYPDIGLDLARLHYHGLRIELKRRRGYGVMGGDSRAGAPSKEQEDWRGWLEAQGYCHRYAWGWEQAREQLLAYVAGREPPAGVRR
jgi:hypothetical protein